MSETIIETMNNENLLTPIQKFYAGANIFVTGATGFLGKILVEKLLRSCPEINTMYILVRNKKGKNMHNRIEELFDDVVFERLRKEYPKFRHKVVGIGGDCSLPEIGLSIQDRQLLINEVSVVFHVAATVRFDEKLKMAVAINVKGPQEILRLCKEMPKLKSVVHVSTAYSNCNMNVIEETFYTPPMESKKLICLTDAAGDKLLENITPIVLDKWPNTYAFTKAVAEDVIRQDSDGLPIAVFRPAIVISTYKEPLKGWINNLYGPTGVAAGAGIGLLRTLHCNSNYNANIIPVDMCVNALIATAWEVSNMFEKCKIQKQTYNIPIYHYESSNDQPITWGKFMFYCEYHGLDSPSVKAIWYYTLTLQSTRLGYYITVFFLHLIPAAIADLALICVGKSPKLLKTYKKIYRFSAVIAYFSTRNWEFKSRRAQNLCQVMSKEDQELFFCNLKHLNWNEFFIEYMKGIRIHLLQDPLDTLEPGKIKWRRLYWLNMGLKLLLAYVVLRIFWSLLWKLLL